MAYTGQDWRNPKWERIKRRALEKIWDGIDEHIEELVDQALGDYMDSEEFKNDAQIFCSEVLDWQKPG